MSKVEGFNDKVAFVWSVADLLRGEFSQSDYGDHALPFLVLRRFDCVLEATKAEVIAKAKSFEGKIDNVGPILERVTGAPFYNLHPLTLTGLLSDPKTIKKNLLGYIAGFSPEAADVLDRYQIVTRVEELDKAGLLYEMVAKFVDMDLHPDVVPNLAMGYIFEELLRRFYELKNEEAGNHFTPREVIHAMVNILLSGDEESLSGKAPVRTIYDPTCGTGGMLSTAQEHMMALNSNSHIEVYGQELNPKTWAICRSDMLIKGQEPDNIVLGNTLTADGHPDLTPDYMVANPPFGVKWDKYAKDITAEAEREGYGGRFGAGLPGIKDGSLLFLQHLLSKMKPVKADGTGGSRIAIVFSGSALFSGAAGEGGPSAIRRWIIENDWLEAVVALPDQLFYNTPISTYFWVLTNRKTDDRKGKVALVDARGMASRMPKSLGNKRNYFTEKQIENLVRLYSDVDETDPRVKVLPNASFGFHRIVIEQPMRRRWVLTKEALVALGASKAWQKWVKPLGSNGDPLTPQNIYVDRLGLLGAEAKTEKDFIGIIKADNTEWEVPLAVVKELAKVSAVADPNGEIIKKAGKPVPDPDLRDYENVPLGEDLDEYLKREVLPFAPEAWIDHSKTKVGYEIPLTRHFYVYAAPRSARELNVEIRQREVKIQKLLGSLL